ncbi:GntG family PLP-dependent aldolase [Limnochorda pilosa]|uniref:Threonine aldolase n=1 Tax=Limnochorda pilosa TaxID=1555112 RepID=A0A0K2SIS6_LIMPI|nr:GntG family PLP-dependent aldolase [Limnochorda pilosa]BAS27031.1 threonine aldolase [Limnochorda pilosa]
MSPWIDLRSDTVTQPTSAMREAMARAEVGDDVYGEDPTVNRLEAEAARRMGKEAGLFCASGTMANLLGVLSQTQPGDELICEAEAHVYYYEVAGMSRIGGVIPRTLPGERGRLLPEQVERALRAPDIHFPPTRLLCLENTHNRGGGSTYGVEETERLARVAHDHGLKVHLDGARIFNAALARGVEAARLAAPADTVMFCLSKGLSAPVGSVLCGPEETIRRARKLRKLVGGGMRQAGVLAAAGLVALEQMVDRLAEDHARAWRLAQALAGTPGVELDPETVETNIVSFEVTCCPEKAFLAALRDEGVLAGSPGPGRVRMVLHRHIGDAELEAAVGAVRRVTARPGAA